MTWSLVFSRMCQFGAYLTAVKFSNMNLLSTRISKISVGKRSIEGQSDNLILYKQILRTKNWNIVLVRFFKGE